MKMTRIVLGLLLLFWTPVVTAYEVTSSGWEADLFSSGIPYCPVVNSKDAPTIPLQSDFMEAIDGAMGAWTNGGYPANGIPAIACSGFVAQKSTCPGSPAYNSSYPWVYWLANWNIPGIGPNVIGVTPYRLINGFIVEAKVVFNDRDFDWSVNGTATDVATIAAHEFGHFLGLDHYDAVDPAKQTDCNNGGPTPSIMCAFYQNVPARVPTTDDAAGVCNLYPLPGVFGAPCFIAGDCDSGQCAAAGYCTRVCPPTCPNGYHCASGLCEKDVPTLPCSACGSLPCESGTSVCFGSSGAAICTIECSTNDDCPLEFECLAVSGGGVCWPAGRTCSTTAPQAGEPCNSGGVCALGAMCVADGTFSGHCFDVCDSDTDCTGTATCTLIEPGLGYCDDCACDTDGSCQTGCACDPACGACSCNSSSSCDSGCACDSDCLTCSCDTSSSCDNNCSCDSGCQACACDRTTTCDDNCACDPECGCACDTTTACDRADGDECSCDPECDGCLSTSVVTPVRGEGLLVTLVLLAILWQRRRNKP